MSLEVVIGPMFSGKSSYALSYSRRQRAIGKRVLIIKPDIDKRYSNQDYMITHDQDKVECMSWITHNSLSDFINTIDYNEKLIANYDCFVFEESQFFNGLYDICSDLLYRKKAVLVVGLDGCAQQKKFGEILDIIPLSASVTKLTALCSVCKDGTHAPYTKKMVEWGGEQVDVGGADKYIAVCLRHL